MIKTLTLATITTLAILLAPWQAQAGGFVVNSRIIVDYGHNGWSARGPVVHRHAHRPPRHAGWRPHRKQHIYWSHGHRSHWERRDHRFERRGHDAGWGRHDHKRRHRW